MPLNSYKDAYAEWAHDYDQSAQEDDFVAPEKIARAIMAHATAKHWHGTLIDLGTGTGAVLQKLNGQFNHAIAVDFSPEMLQQCRGKNLADEIVECDLTQQNWPPSLSKADIVTSAGLMEYIRRPEPFFNNVASIMKDGAIGALTYEKMVPCKNAGLQTYRSFTPARIDEAVAQSGMRMLQHSHFDAYKHRGQTIVYGLIVLTR